jgi:hypothetical protein
MDISPMPICDNRSAASKITAADANVIQVVTVGNLSQGNWEKAKGEHRMIFARRAVSAAKWAMGKKPGLYSMTDVLGV